MKRAGNEIDLTAKEFSLLEFFVLNAGHVVDRAAITAHVWDDNHDPLSNNIDVLITRIRRKLDAGRNDSVLHTRRGAGYMPAVPPAP